jgi:hypothetical protein
MSAAPKPCRLGKVPLALHRPGSLPNCVGEGHKIVGGGGRRLELAVVADQFPPTGRGEASGVRLAQVVGVRFGIGSQWTHDRGRLRIHVRQRRDRQPGAAVAGAAPW